jgi:hypothetical protein
MIMLSIILGATLYSTTLLTASTLLPQMQGAMSATQDEVAWTMTFKHPGDAPTAFPKFSRPDKPDNPRRSGTS